MFILIGAGGHAKVIYEALRAAGVMASDIQIRDGNHLRQGESFLDQVVQTPELPSPDEDLSTAQVHISIGNLFFGIIVRLRYL